MKIISSLICVIVSLLIIYSCNDNKNNHKIIINASSDTTIILTRPDYAFSTDAGGEFMGGSFLIKTIQGYSDSLVSISISDVHKERRYCMYDYVYKIDSGKINKNELRWDFYAGKVRIKFNHQKAKKGQIILNIEF